MFRNDKNYIDNISSYEWNIINKILIWRNIVINAGINEEPHKIIYYLEDLASMFHIFWNKGKDDKNLRFININNSDKTKSKLFWIIAMQIVFRSAFKLIGIKPIKNM